jgi:hypothetical protein
LEDDFNSIPHVAQKSSLTDCLDNSLDDEGEGLIRDLVKTGGIPNNSPELENLAGISRIRVISNSIEQFVEHLLTTFPEQWRIEREQKQLDDQKLLSEFQKLLITVNKAIDKLVSLNKPSSDIKLKMISCGAISAVAATILSTSISAFLLYPAQINASKGSDAIVHAFLATPQGQLFLRSSQSKGFTLEKCIADAKARNIKPKSKGELPCLVFIK